MGLGSRTGFGRVFDLVLRGSLEIYVGRSIFTSQGLDLQSCLALREMKLGSLVVCVVLVHIFKSNSNHKPIHQL